LSASSSEEAHIKIHPASTIPANATLHCPVKSTQIISDVKRAQTLLLHGAPR
jgi:hypothetical protein